MDEPIINDDIKKDPKVLAQYIFKRSGKNFGNSQRNKSLENYKLIGL